MSIPNAWQGLNFGLGEDLGHGSADALGDDAIEVDRDQTGS